MKNYKSLSLKCSVCGEMINQENEIKYLENKHNYVNGIDLICAACIKVDEEAWTVAEVYFHSNYMAFDQTTYYDVKFKNGKQFNHMILKYDEKDPSASINEAPSSAVKELIQLFKEHVASNR